jgi:hypothetical protein
MAETYFYPPLKDYEQTRDLVLEALEEHALIDEMISKVEHVAYDTEEWTAKFIVLKELIEHHVKAEEDALFPKVHQVMQQEELEEIGKNMLELKAKYK